MYGMRFDVLTLFPDLFSPYLERSILKRAIAENHITVVTHNLRDYGADERGTVDDPPYGGGSGMV